MNDPSKFDWYDVLLGGAMGICTGIAAMFGWFSDKIGKVHDRIDTLHAKVGGQETHIAVLVAHHDAHIQFQERIDSTLASLNAKHDAQMQILLELKGRTSH